MPPDGTAHPDGAPGAGTPVEEDAVTQIFVPDLDELVLDPDDAHHLRHVLRLRAGETVVAADGRGRWRRCTWSGVTPVDAMAAHLEPDGPVHRTPRLAPEVTVAFVPVKGARPEWVVQKLTEVGVDHIAVLSSARAVVRWDRARRAGALERLERVARGAAAQSRRPWLPEVCMVEGLSELADRLAPVLLALAHPGGDAPSTRAPAVAIGPEGGWDDNEAGAGYGLVDLGPTVLRAETAAVAAGLLLCALRGGLVRPAAEG